ncbi:MAG: uncharacterized protein A8A55_0125 [Amphiamblys sp. WSBS2006]|nr:MAG: uncharacterized protein A8A55_0125 [Amphiamblys sp. WSBS2006]
MRLFFYLLAVARTKSVFNAYGHDGFREDRYTSLFENVGSETHAEKKKNNIMELGVFDGKRKEILCFYSLYVGQHISFEKWALSRIGLYKKFYFYDCKMYNMFGILPGGITELYIFGYCTLYNYLILSHKHNLEVLSVGKMIMDDCFPKNKYEELFNPILMLIRPVVPDRKITSSDKPVFPKLHDLIIQDCDLFFELVDLKSCTFGALKNVVFSKHSPEKALLFPSPDITKIFLKSPLDFSLDGCFLRSVQKDIKFCYLSMQYEDGELADEFCKAAVRSQTFMLDPLYWIPFESGRYYEYDLQFFWWGKDNHRYRGCHSGIEGVFLERDLEEEEKNSGDFSYFLYEENTEKEDLLYQLFK